MAASVALLPARLARLERLLMFQDLLFAQRVHRVCGRFLLAQAVFPDK